MAPEIEDLKSGAGISYGYPADLWSVGVVLYMLLMFDFPRFEDSDKRSRLLVLIPPTSWGNILLLFFLPLSVDLSFLSFLLSLAAFFFFVLFSSMLSFLSFTCRKSSRCSA